MVSIRENFIDFYIYRFHIVITKTVYAKYSNTLYFAMKPFHFAIFGIICIISNGKIAK